MIAQIDMPTTPSYFSLTHSARYPVGSLSYGALITHHSLLRSAAYRLGTPRRPTPRVRVQIGTRAAVVLPSAVTNAPRVAPRLPRQTRRISFSRRTCN